VKYELGFYIPEDDILHIDRRENLKSYISTVDSVQRFRPAVTKIRCTETLQALGTSVPKRRQHDIDVSYPHKTIHNHQNIHKISKVKCEHGNTVLRRCTVQPVNASSYLQAKAKFCRAQPRA
jgi:hypothetical protein